MKEFDENAVCPKCGSDRITIWYCSGWKGPAKQRWFGCSEDIEHLHRTCKLCGFRWLEECLDATD